MKTTEDKIPDITRWAANASLNAKTNEVKCEIPSIANLATTAALNGKTNEAKSKIPSITNLATTAAALTAVENKIHNVSDSVKIQILMQK